MAAYKRIIEEAYKDGGLLDALLAIQKRDGFVTEEGLGELADYVGVSVAELYDTASFYSMLRFAPGAKTDIRVCRGTACHSGGSTELIAAIENATGVKLGEISADGKYYFDYVECLGQCQSAPNMLINGRLYSGVKATSVAKLIKEGGGKR